MSLEEYMGALKGQIRDKSARILVSDEISAHIEEQADSYLQVGMDREEALSKAVEDMGDPVSVGADLDRIHRPHMEWRYLIFIMFISILSIVIQYLIAINMDSRSITGNAFLDITRRHIIGIMAGIIAMFLVYRIDYTVLLGRSRLIGGIFMAAVTLAAVLFGIRINGSSGLIRIGFASFSLRALMMLYIPIFAGILYELRGKGKWVMARIVFWMILPVISPFFTGDLSIPSALFILLAETVLIFIAVHKNWYDIDKKIVYGGFSAVFAGLIMAGTAFILRLNTYQSARFANWLSNLGVGSGITDDTGVNYLNAQLGKVFAHSAIIGKSDEAVRIMSDIPGYWTDLVMGSIAAIGGLIMVAGIIICMLALATYMIIISARQKNNLGYITGCACGIVVALQSISNTLIVFGLLPMTGSTLPIFTSSISYCIVDYAMIGMVLSIYRYKDIRGDYAPKNIHKNGKQEIVT
jgi:cell division protein FtsW (lipid II flippase)